MPAPALVRPRERLVALAAVALVQLTLGLVLLNGFRVDVLRQSEIVSRLIDITLPPPPPSPRTPVPAHQVERKTQAAPKAVPRPIGGSPGPVPSSAMPSPTPIVALHPSAPTPGGGSGTGPARGSGGGGGSGGNGTGDGGGGTDLEKIAGDILPSDYPRSLGEAGIGGTVSVTFTVETNGRVTGCRIIRSSGVPQLDAMTCQLMEQRFRFRPSTDRYGRPIRDEVDWDHDWIAPRRF